MVSKRFLRAARALRKKGPFQRGLLGNATGDIQVADRPGYYYVRVEKPGGYEEGIFPGRVPPYLNLPVRIETHPITDIQYIAGVDDKTLTYAGQDPADVPDVDPHAETHEWGGADMLMWLHTSQIFPLRCQAHASDTESVTIQGGTYFAEGEFCALTATQDVDLTSYYPVSGRKYVLLYLMSDGVAAVQDDGAPTLTSMEPAPPGAFWVAAVRLQAGQPVTWQDIVDLRFLNAGVIGGGMIDLGADYITLGDDYPVLTGEWMRIGTQGDNWDGCRDVDTEVYGTTAVKAENGIGMLLEDVAGVVDRALLIWGGNYEIPMVIRRCDGDTGSLDVMSIDWNGDISVLAGSLIMPAGETVDTVDVSEHTHNGSAGDAPALPFLNLSDTPSIYTGQAGKVATVNPTEDGLVFEEGGGGGGGTETALTFQARYWTIDGPLAAADEIGGVWRVAENFIISTITIYLRDAGDTGNTIIDVERSDDGGQTWTSLFPTSPKPTLPGGQLDRRASAIPDTTLVFQNDLLRVNIDNVATADPGYGARGLSVQIDGEVHQMTPTIYVVTLTTADTEYSQALPTGVRAVSFRARDGSTEVRFAWETGKVATPTDPYQTLQPGREYFKENIIAASETLYLASSTAGTEIEIEVWA